MFNVGMVFSGDFNHSKRVFFAVCFLHLAPEDNPEYLSHFGKSVTTFVTEWISILNKQCIYQVLWCCNTDQVLFKLKNWYMMCSTACKL